MSLARQALPAALLVLSVLAHTASAQDAAPPLPADLAIIAPAYAEGVAELRSFMVACAPKAPADWDESASALVSSLVAAGLDRGVADTVAATLARAPASAECTDETAAFRNEFRTLESWMTYHRDALRPLGIPLVAPEDMNDPRLGAAREALAAHAGPQATMLSCMALVAPELFPAVYADWDDVIDRAEEAVRVAGFPETIARELIQPSRSAALFKPAGDRAQATRDCVSDQSWLNRYATFFWYTVAADVQKAVGVQ